MTDRAATVNEIGRGILIIFVFYVHSLYIYAGVVANPAAVAPAWFQLKILAPQVAVFFLLAGMTSHAIAERPLRVVLARSLMLVFLASASHAVGVLLETLLYPGDHPWSGLAGRLARPILHGTGYSTFVAWFFVVLGTTRLLAWCFYRHLAVFAACALAVAMVGMSAERLGLPDNVFEWRNLPVSVVLFLVGMRLSGDRPVPHWAAAVGAATAVVLGLLVTPDLQMRGLCLRCDLTFVAEPMVGEYGFLPAYMAMVAGGSVLLLWGAQRVADTRAGMAARFFGRPSLVFLLLHGWVITAVYPAATLLLPRQENLLVYPVIMVFNVVLHAALFTLLRPLLDAVVAFCSRAARFVVAVTTKRARRGAS